MDKKNALPKFWDITKKSWTYEKLTKKEKEKLKEVIFSTRTENALRGSFQERWDILQSIYFGFLMALDYEPINWRSEEKGPLF